MRSVRRSSLLIGAVLALGMASEREARAASTDLAYSTINPCRLIDTRRAGGPIAAGTTRDFKVKGTGSLASQGGSATGCGVPSTATGAMINFVSTNPAGAGNLVAWAYPVATAPLASTLNYGIVPGLNAIANGIAVPICDPDLNTCTFDLRIKTNASATDVVADVVGYFSQPIPSPAVCSSPPCSVAVCSDSNTPTCQVTISVSSATPCVASSQSGSCRGAFSCKVCQGPALPASSTAACSDTNSPTCSFTTLATANAASCQVASAGGVCKGLFGCKVCTTQ